MNEGKPTKAKWWSRPRAHGAGGGTTGDHIGPTGTAGSGAPADAVREEPFEGGTEGDFELERPATSPAPGGVGAGAASDSDFGSGVDSDSGSRVDSDFELARPAAGVPLGSDSVPALDAGGDPDGDFELELPAATAAATGAAGGGGDASAGASVPGEPGVPDSGGSTGVAVTAVAATVVVDARPSDEQGTLSAPGAPSERRKPLHDPDPYSTPPYGEPGPWAPAPPVQHPATTPAPGTNVQTETHGVPAAVGAPTHGVPAAVGAPTDEGAAPAVTPVQTGTTSAATTPPHPVATSATPAPASGVPAHGTAAPPTTPQTAPTGPYPDAPQPDAARHPEAARSAAVPDEEVARPAAAPYPDASRPEAAPYPEAPQPAAAPYAEAPPAAADPFSGAPQAAAKPFPEVAQPAAAAYPDASQSSPPGASYAYPAQPGPPPFGDSAQAVPPPYAGGAQPTPLSQPGGAQAVPPPYAGGAQSAPLPHLGGGPAVPPPYAGGAQPVPPPYAGGAQPESLSHAGGAQPAPHPHPAGGLPAPHPHPVGPQPAPSAFVDPAQPLQAMPQGAQGPWQRYDPWAGAGVSQQSGGRRRGRGRVLLVGALVIAVVAGGVGGAVGAYLERNGGVGAVELPQASDGVTGRAADSVAGIAAGALPSVVTLHVSGASAQGTGTGFVLDERGHILTNNHVVDPAGTNGDISVTFSGGETAEATIVGRDTGYDLAVVKVTGVSGLKPLPLGNSEEVRVGDPVVAIGAPFDLANTVTSGIISAKERPITAGGEGGDVSDVSYVDALQTDAPINPGNSGGPLLDGKGRVIGINSAIRSAGGGSESDGGQAGSIGLGFAIPINQGKRVAEELINTGKATHPVIGVTLDTDYAGDGARIGDEGGSGVTAGGPADRAGIRSGDVVTEVDGQRVHSNDELIVKVRAHRPGDRLELTLLRNGDERTVTLTLGSSGD
ncbi:trypsin-like peptidase domain-containing protein [Streptomyces sp. NPDC001868]|uniref:S1C family serine protease n=1 Tax=Streptomyces sp. NPDC001868 TaxID=3154401 RepID=UPI0033198F2C